MSLATEQFDGGKPMTLLEHLQELRSRLIWCAISLVVAMGISSIVVRRVMNLLMDKAREAVPDVEFIFTGPTEDLSTFFRVALLGGLIIAMPMLVYQILMFVLPALTPQEKRWVLPIVVGIFLSFVGGVAFSYYFILPPSVDVLFGTGFTGAKPTIRVGEYFDFVTRLLFWVGVTFEMPIFILALARFGMVTGRKMLGMWKFAIVGAFVLSAIITPTIDPVTQTLVAGPIIVLWIIGTGLAFIFGPKAQRS